MKNRLFKTVAIAALSLASLGAKAAVDWSTPMSCSQQERYVAQLGQSNLNGLTLVPVEGHPKFTSFDFSPYVNSSMLVSNQQTFPMIDAFEDEDGNVVFYTKAHRKHKLSRGGMMFKFERVDDEHYNLTLWKEKGPAVKLPDGSKGLPFAKPQPITKDGAPLRLRVTEESLRERAKHKCIEG